MQFRCIEGLGLASRCLRLVAKAVLKEQSEVWYAARRCFQLIHDSKTIVVCLLGSIAMLSFVDMLFLVGATLHERRYNAVRAMTSIPSLAVIITVHGAIRVI